MSSFSSNLDNFHLFHSSLASTFFSLLLRPANQFFLRIRSRLTCLLISSFWITIPNVMQQEHDLLLVIFSNLYVFANLLFSSILLTCSSCSILNCKIVIYILLTVLVLLKFFTNSTGFVFRLEESNRPLITLIIEFIHIFQYDAIFFKINFSNINLLNKAVIIVVLVFPKVKIRKAFCCNIVSSEDFLELNYIISDICHLIRKF